MHHQNHQDMVNHHHRPKQYQHRHTVSKAVGCYTGRLAHIARILSPRRMVCLLYSITSNQTKLQTGQPIHLKNTLSNATGRFHQPHHIRKSAHLHIRKSSNQLCTTPANLLTCTTTTQTTSPQPKISQHIPQELRNIFKLQNLRL